MLPVSYGKGPPSPSQRAIVSNETHENTRHAFSSGIKGVSLSPVSLELRPAPSPSVQKAMSDVYRDLTGVRRLTLNVDFNQAEFVGDASLAQRGVCVPLVAKWLTERELDQPIDFFSDIQSEGGREEIMHLAIEAARRGNGSAIVDYLDAKCFDMEAVEADRVESPGLYSVSLQFEDGGLHNIALHIEESDYANNVTMFDPNYGEFCFGSIQDFYAFLDPYLKNAYTDKVSESDLSFVQFVSRDWQTASQVMRTR